MLQGETTTVTVHFNVACPGGSHPDHIVFALDGSASMAGEPSRNLRASVGFTIEAFALAENESTQLGVVEFNGSARTACRLMADEKKLLACVSRANASGPAAIDRGIVEAQRVLRTGRAGAERWTMPNDVLILVSDGMNDRGGNPVRAAARRAKEQGILVITLCASRRCDEAAMREWATSPRYLFQAEDYARLITTFDRIRSTNFSRSSLRRLDLTEAVPDSMELVDAGSDPTPSRSGDPPTLTWTYRHVPKEGVTVTFRLRPRVAGQHGVSLGAGADFMDDWDRRGSLTIPMPDVAVFRADTVADPGPIGSAADGTGLPTKEPSP